MSEPFLILHKVRGEPAFDIAEQMEVNGEVWWIVPTSGHRAYPWYVQELSNLGVDGVWSAAYCVICYPEDEIANDPVWAELPDHYQASEARSRLATAAGDLLSLIGLGKAKPQEPVKRRVIP